MTSQEDNELLDKRDALREEHAAAMRGHVAACENVARISRELDKVHAEIKRRALENFEGCK